MNIAMMAESQLDINEALHFKNTFKKLDAMRRKSQNCDIIITAEGKDIHVHKNILLASSDYFDAMFSHDTVEEKRGVVQMEEVTYVALEKCIDYMYSGKFTVTKAKCEEVLYAARLMQLDEVCEKTALYLRKFTTANSFFDIKRIADKFSLKDLIQFCNRFAVQNLLLLSQQQEFNNIDFEYLSLLLMAIRSPGREIEDAKLCIALQWIKNDLDKREIHLMKLVNLVDVTKLNVWYCKYLFENEELCHRSVKLVRSLCVRFSMSQYVASSGPPDLKKIHGNSLSNSLILFNMSSSEVVHYNHSEISITKIVDYHESFQQLTSCIAKNCLYVFLENMEAYWISLDNITTWEPLGHMLHCHGENAQCTVCEESIYVGGGYELERYNFKESKWENVDLVNVLCDESAIISDNKSVYIIGGIDVRGSSTKAVSKYSPSSATWMSIPPMHLARMGASAIFLNSNLFVAGGYNYKELADFEMFDGESWTILCQMSCARSRFRLCFLDNKIFAVGGYSTLESYDDEKNKWVCSEVGPLLDIYGPATVSISMFTGVTDC